MPTGTGKSGVIAVISRCFDDTPNVLVVVPWIVLREQLADDINRRFWAKVSTDPGKWPKLVRKILPKTASAVLKETLGKNTAFVCTINTLQTIYSRHPSVYDALKRRVSLVIVDEGHREPAPEWAESVRELRKPTVLFTATPYRNDHKMFNVDPEHVFVYSHQDAVKERCIREVEFINNHFNNSAADFVEALLSFYYGRFQKLKPPGLKRPRVIVRCETSNEVNDIASRLRNKGQKVIAIHDRFPEDEEDFRRKRVPAPESTDAIFWVHQRKLIEGIDDSSFVLLAIYRPLLNARALVQQIGRIVRNPGMKEGQRAFVFSDPAYRQDVFWQGYRKYERDYESNPERYELRQLLDIFVQLQPEHQYFEGDYRRRFDAKTPDLHGQFRYRLSASIRIANEKISMKQLALAVKEEWEKADIDILQTVFPDKRTWVHAYVTYENSGALLNQAFLEFSIGYTICRSARGYVFFYDSQGNLSEYLANNTRRVAPSQLQRLFSGTASRLSEISLINSDLGRYSIRRRIIGAYSIADTAPGLADHAHFSSTATGFVDYGKKGLVRRYVGFTRARITDPSFIPRDYDAFVQWVDSVAEALDREDREVLSLFDRFATFTDPPKDTDPVNILLDIDDVMESFETVSLTGGVRVPLQLDDLCYDIKSNSFVCVANSKEYPVTVTYDSDREAYNLFSVQLEKAYVRRDSSGERVRDNLIAYLNHSQSFRIVPQTPGVIYAHWHFYEPRLPLWGKVQTDRFDLLRILDPLPQLSSILSEKGHHCLGDGSGWETGSLFHLIDTLGHKTGIQSELADIDILVCDDLGNEIADFVAVSTSKRRAILIHAKAFQSAAKRSASSLQEVCAQAVKNLEYIHPYSRLKPPNLNLWKEQWKGGSIGLVKKRIRLGTGSPEKIWRDIQQVIRDPRSSREVWILLGKGLSRSELERQRSISNPAPEIVQILYLLQSTWGAVASVGATLRVCCSP